MLQAGRLLRPQLSAPAPAGRPRVARRRLSCGPLAALGAPSPKSDDDGIVKTRLGYPRLAESQKIHYGEFLDLMRAQEVKEIVFTHEGTERSAVVLKDGGIRYVQIPSDDPRIFDFMSTYGERGCPPLLAPGARPAALSFGPEACRAILLQAS